MSFRVRATVLASSVALLGSALTVPAAAASSGASEAGSFTPAQLRAGLTEAQLRRSCPRGDVCFWNTSGQRCNWNVADPNWSGGNIRCSWAKTKNVRYIYNNGRSSAFTGVAYYKSTNYRNRVGCTRQGKQGYLRGTYKVASHRWITGSCG